MVAVAPGKSSLINTGLDDVEECGLSAEPPWAYAAMDNATAIHSGYKRMNSTSKHIVVRKVERGNFGSCGETVESVCVSSAVQSRKLENRFCGDKIFHLNRQIATAEAIISFNF